MEKEKIALVTGAYRGLGLEWCRQLAKNGYRVILTARDPEKAKSASGALQKIGLRIIPESLDVQDESQVVKLASEIESEFGRLDLLVNNAGINSKDDPDRSLFPKSFRLSDLDPEEVVRHIRINSIAPVILVKHFRELLRKAENPVVISIGSWLGSITVKDFGGHYGYATSKSALNMMNRAMALEIKEEGIIAVVVNPGWVQTDMGGNNAKLTPEESVRGIINNVLQKITINDTGKFFQWDGSEHPW